MTASLGGARAVPGGGFEPSGVIDRLRELWLTGEWAPGDSLVTEAVTVVALSVTWRL